MPQWNLRRTCLSLITILVVVAALAFLGCNNNNDAKPSDFAGLTLTVPAGFIDAAAAAENGGTIEFSADGSTATITFPDGTVADVNVTEGSIVLTVTAITVNGVDVQSADLDGDGVDDITVGDTYEFDVTIDETTQDGVTTTVFVFTNSDGTVSTFTFEGNATGATGTTGG